MAHLSLSSRRVRLYGSSYSDRDQQYLNNNDGHDGFSRQDVAQLADRLTHLKVAILEREFHQPPNPHLTPCALVETILSSLVAHANADSSAAVATTNTDRTTPEEERGMDEDAGVRMLLRSSTKAWRRQLYASVGAPPEADPRHVASALREAMGRPHNQFGILVDSSDSSSNGKPFATEFPSDVMEDDDEHCWVECRLRSMDSSNKLLVITGWYLEREASIGAWMVAGLDWQDFRDEYRPGIGREEWLRICG